MHRRRRQHNRTRNALCCHRRRPADNLHDFSVSAQQSAFRIIHSSFDLDGRHSTASHSSGCISTSVEPKLFLHLHQSRALFIFRKRSVLEILFHLACAKRKNTTSAISAAYRLIPFHHRRSSRERCVATRSSIKRCAALVDKFLHVIY